MLAAEMCSVWPSYLRLARPLAADHDVDAVIAEDALQQADVGEPRHVVEDERLIGQQARDHQRQRGVLGAGDRDGAVERPAADDANAIHAPLPVPVTERRQSMEHLAARAKAQTRRRVTARSSGLSYPRQFRRNRGVRPRAARPRQPNGLWLAPCGA